MEVFTKFKDKLEVKFCWIFLAWMKGYNLFLAQSLPLGFLYVLVALFLFSSIYLRFWQHSMKAVDQVMFLKSSSYLAWTADEDYLWILPFRIKKYFYFSFKTQVTCLSKATGQKIKDSPFFPTVNKSTGIIGEVEIN